MVKAGADRPDDMSLHGQLAIKQDAEVEENVSRFHDGRAPISRVRSSGLSRLREDQELNQISPVLEAFSWSLRDVHHSCRSRTQDERRWRQRWSSLGRAPVYSCLSSAKRWWLRPCRSKRRRARIGANCSAASFRSHVGTGSRGQCLAGQQSRSLL